MTQRSSEETGVWSSGLDGVVVANTSLSKVDGERGVLTIAGIDVEALQQTGFEQLADRLLQRGRGATGDGSDLVFAKRVGQARMRAFQVLQPAYGVFPHIANGMDALRLATSLLESTPEMLLGGIAVACTSWHRLRHGFALIEPDEGLSHSEDFLRMLGVASSSVHARALNRYWVTVSDHGMNASTFTARVVASTASDLASCVGAAIGALKGPLHGGAPGPVLDMLDAIGAGDAEAWIIAALNKKERIMGMGHRIYRVRDPRADVLERALDDALQNGVTSKYQSVARRVERTAREVLKQRYPERALDVNVEFYTAVLLDALSIPRDCFAATFACGRTAGWCAHATEQQRVGRLIRPDSRYVDSEPMAQLANP